MNYVWKNFLPNKVVAYKGEGQKVGTVPLLEGKYTIDGKTTFYVCEDKICFKPDNEIEELTKQVKNFKLIKGF